MVAMSGSGPGHSQTVIITPYMHALIYHVPVLLRTHGSHKLFSGQGKYSCRLTLQLRFLEIVLSVIEYKHQSFICCNNFSSKSITLGRIWVFLHFHKKNFWIKYFIQLLDTMFDSIWTDKILLNFFEGVEKKNDDLRPSSDAVLHMSRIECKWEKSFVLPH